MSLGVARTDELYSFHPGYLTAERLAKAKKLKIAITAGIGSDHVDLNAANKTNGGITVAEVTGSNVVSVAEHVLMTILVLVRNFVPAHEQIQAGDWNVAAAAKNEYDLENKVVGTVGVGRIGERVLRRLKPFDCKELLYYDYQPLKPEVEKEIGARRVDKLEDMLAQCDVVTINCPLHESTYGLFNKELIAKMKPGSWLVNTARGAIVVKEDVAEALKSGHLRGYGGDVWFPQPAPKDHPLRYAKNPFGGGNATVPHMSGTSLDAQKRYAEGTKSILQSYLTGSKSLRDPCIITLHTDTLFFFFFRKGLPPTGPYRDRWRLCYKSIRTASQVFGRGWCEQGVGCEDMRGDGSLVYLNKISRNNYSESFFGTISFSRFTLCLLGEIFNVCQSPDK